MPAGSRYSVKTGFRSMPTGVARWCCLFSRGHPMKFPAYAWLPLAAAFVPQFAAAAPFTAGDLVVYRIGDGVAALSTAGAAVFIDEYTPAGAFVQSIPMPTAASGSNKACVGTGNASSEGLITRSADGKFLVGACYAAPVGTASLNATTAAAAN